MELSFEQILNSARQLLKEADALTPDLNQQLNNLSDLEQNLQAIREIQTQEEKRAQTLVNACESVVRSNYLILKVTNAALSKALHEMDKEVSELPKTIQPVVKEIKSYFASLEKKIREIDALIFEIEGQASCFLLDKGTQTKSRRKCIQ